jgi:hypothetical protein
VIATGIQVLPNRVFVIDEFEAFNKERLFSIIRRGNKALSGTVLLLSGDVHFS